MKRISRAAVLGSAALFGMPTGPAIAQESSGSGKPIELEIGEAEPGKVFHCRLPVTVHYSGRPALATLTAVATVHKNGSDLKSTGIRTADRPLLSRIDDDGMEYLAIPLQFELDERSCENFTGLRIDFASCTFDDGEAADCRSRLQLHPESTAEVDFAIRQATPSES